MGERWNGIQRRRQARRIRALRLRRRGFTYYRIAVLLGCAIATARDLVQEALQGGSGAGPLPPSRQRPSRAKSKRSSIAAS